MEQITFPNIRLEKVSGGLKIIHIKTGGYIVLTVAEFEKLAISQLKKFFQ
jgi:hypothetical protein